MTHTHDFSPLFEHYEGVIAEMPAVFTSHQFILRLAQRHQPEYIEALHAYRNTLRDGRPAPFMNVHRVLALQLQECPGLVSQVASNVPSRDIFGTDNTCAQWRKV